MKLDENYSIERDAHCWILKYEKAGGINEKTGKQTVTRKETYYNSIKSALVVYLDSVLDAKSEIPELLAKISETEARIMKLWENVKEL